MPAMVMSHDVDPREELASALGSLDDFEVCNNQILVAVYQRGGKDGAEKKTLGGIIIPGKSLDEDRFQSKVGLIVKMGPSAFDDENGVWFKGIKFGIGDWVVYRASDGWNIELVGAPPRVNNQVNKILCRLMDDTAVRARIKHPDAVW